MLHEPEEEVKQTILYEQTGHNDVFSIKKCGLIGKCATKGLIEGDGTAKLEWLWKRISTSTEVSEIHELR